MELKDLNFKVGDTVKGGEDFCGEFTDGKTATIDRIQDEGNGYAKIYFNGCSHTLDIKTWNRKLTLVSSTNNSIMSNIKEKFVLAFLKEPEKSFRKAGITDGDGFLTDDGQKVFLGFLLSKHGEEFKKDVVDGILKDQEEEKA